LPNDSDPIDSSSPSQADPRALIAICTLNEADNITQLVTRLRQSTPSADILVVDDNSTDGTGSLVAEIAQQDAAVTLIVRTHERGLGSAIRLAMQHAIDHDYTYFLNLDGDLSHDPDQLPGLLQRACESPQVEVVIGSRYVRGGKIVGWPIHRKLMSRMVNRFAILCLRLPVNDCSGSMRCYRVDALSQLGISNLRFDGYAMLEELLVGLHRQGAAMAEVPITFTDRRQGESKLTFTEATRSITQMLALALRR
jgi:dolichol-phosphate mannosyltransferase